MVSALLLALLIPASAAPSWVDKASREIRKLDAATPGSLGVFIRRLEDGSELSYHADRRWYLASTVKIPVAIALLQRSEEGTISLDQEITLQKSDYVDGTGAVLWKEPGTRLSLSYLLEKMLTESDSTAADMIIRAIGPKELNDRLRTKMRADGFNEITTLLQVRYDAFGELHPSARSLTNMDFIDLKKAKTVEEKLEVFLAKTGIAKTELKTKGVDEAFERYYRRGLNSAPLKSFGHLLEKLAEGKLLSPANTELVLSLMEKMVTGEKRIKAGLPAELRFAQKTGTQIRRICNVGLVRPKEGARDPVVVAACLEKFPDTVQAEAALKQLGAALTRSGVFEPAPVSSRRKSR